MGRQLLDGEHEDHTSTLFQGSQNLRALGTKYPNVPEGQHCQHHGHGGPAPATEATEHETCGRLIGEGNPQGLQQPVKVLQRPGVRLGPDKWATDPSMGTNRLGLYLGTVTGTKTGTTHV